MREEAMDLLWGHGTAMILRIGGISALIHDLEGIGIRVTLTVMKKSEV
jgi:hypothetical protein